MFEVKVGAAVGNGAWCGGGQRSLDGGLQLVEPALGITPRRCLVFAVPQAARWR